jgi:hypothetical protein
VGRHDRLALATKTEFALTAGAERRPAWFATIVARGAPPRYLVKQIGGTEWLALSVDEIPDWAASTTRMLTRTLDGAPLGDLRWSS